MAGLAVNVDHVATLRQARGADYPDPIAAAVLAELAGVDGIVVHLREDRRHIQDRDVHLLRKIVKTKLILEMAATAEMIAIAKEIRPNLVTLVPEKREELTTEGGLDVLTHTDTVAEAVATLQQSGIPVSIFIDPDEHQIKKAKDVKADMIEIHTGIYCDTELEQEKRKAFENIIESAELAKGLGMGVNAGHGLDYITIKPFKGFKVIDEFSIGHSIVSRAVMVGMQRAVREMVDLIKAL